MFRYFQDDPSSPVQRQKEASPRGLGETPPAPGNTAPRLSRRLANPLLWILGLALVVRFINLTYHSFWFDEAMSAFWAAKPAAEIWRVGLALTADKHPPIYYLMLRAWSGLFGQGDFALRSLGAILGALAVLPAYGIGWRLAGRQAGLAAALLLALNPFLVWYSQEARMFMPATTFSLVGLYGVLALGDLSRTEVAPARARRQALTALIGLVLGFSAAFYSYLYSAFLLPVGAAWVILLWWQDRGRPAAKKAFWLGTAALAVVAMLCLPLAWSAWQVAGAEARPGRPFVGLLPSLAPLLKVYTLGWPRWDESLLWAIAGAAGILALAGILAPRTRPDQRGGLFLAAWFGLVILTGGYLLGRDSGVFAETRYQIALAPALCLAWGRALDWLRRRQRLAGLALATLLLAITLAALRFDWAPENRREAWREAAAFIEAHAGPNDAILIHADYVHVAFARYFSGPQPVFYPFSDRLRDAAAIDPPLSGLAPFDAVWLVQSHNEEQDPDHLILGWFAARYPLITEVYPMGIAIRGFAQHYRPDHLPSEVAILDPPALIGPAQLLSCSYRPAKLAAADDLLHSPSNWVHVTTYWRLAGEPPESDFLPVIRLVDQRGEIWGESLVRSNDAFHLWPTARWLPEELLRADHDVNLNPITPAGRYNLIVEGPEGGEKALCGEVEIVE